MEILKGINATLILSNEKFTLLYNFIPHPQPPPEARPCMKGGGRSLSRKIKTLDRSLGTLPGFFLQYGTECTHIVLF